MNIMHRVRTDAAAAPLPSILYEHSLRGKQLGGIKLPLVSIIITNHNYINYVRQAINSVTLQTYPHFECIIVDDFSSDGSYKSVQTYLHELNDDRFRVLQTPINLGQFGAIRVGLENTTGPFVCTLDADDMLFPQFVEEHVAAHLNGVWSAPVSGSDSCQINADGEILEGTQWFLKKPNVRYDAPRYIMGVTMFPIFSERDGCGESKGAADNNSSQLYYIPGDNLGYHAATTSCLMFRRSFLELASPPLAEKVCADYYYYVLAHALSGTIIIPRPLTYYRLHGSNNFNKGTIFGGVTSFPDTLAQINARLHKIMLDKLLSCEREFSVYPKDKYYTLIRYLIAKQDKWRYGKESDAARRAFGYNSRRRFMLNYHPLLRKLPIKKFAKRK